MTSLSKMFERIGQPGTQTSSGRWSTPPDDMLTEGHYRAVIEASIHAFIAVDQRGIVTSWSPGAAAMLGYTAEEMIGTSVTRLFPPGPDPQAEFQRLFDPVRSGSRMGTIEAVRITKDGRRLNVVLTAAAHQNAAGDIVGMGAILTDVTSHRSVEKFLGLVVEACPSGLIVCDQGGIVVLVNQATEALFGFGRDELVGRPVEVLVPQRLRGRHAVLRSDFSAQDGRNRTSFGRVMTACCKDGSEMEFEIGLAPFSIEGRPMFLGVIFDVRERQRIERIKDELIATVSHELRTPLTSIIGSLGLLLGGVAGPLPESAGRLLTIAQSNGQRLVRLVNDMLDIEKIEAGKIAFGFRRTDLRSLVEQAIEGNTGFAEQFGVRVMLDPESRGIASVDPDRMIQVVTNLLSNACKFSPAGSEVRVRVEERDGVARISVRDCGAGIPEEFRHRLFEKFAQADDTLTRQREGSGLGLAIVRQIVEQHGGRVDFAPVPEGGTLFRVDLPANHADVSSLPVAARAAGPVAALICSNDLATSTALGEVVRACGFAAEMTPTAAAALHHPDLDRFGLFVLELPPPDLDGVEFVRRLRAAPSRIAVPIVVVTVGGTSAELDLRYEDLGILGWLDKPVDRRRLGRILGRVANGDGRSRVLHVEGDVAMRDLVARLLRREFDLVAAPSFDAAASILRYAKFDAAVIGLDCGFAATHVPAELCDADGRPIPTVVHAHPAAGETGRIRCETVLVKSPTSVLALMATLRRLVDGGATASGGEEAA